jgi:DNA ligase (NAD+)
MDKKEIKKLYNSKVNLLKKYNESYFDKNKSIVSDKEYDEIKKEVLDLEKNFSYLVSKFSPSQIVGFKPSKNFKKSLHKIPMLSLGNAFSEEDLINFEKRIKNYLSC